jgi:hypothetical protein
LSKSDLYGFVRRERNKNAKKEKEKLGKNWKKLKKSKRLDFCNFGSPFVILLFVNDKLV